jgi:hypothetical protein
MASTQALCTSFKTELLTGTHVLGTDALKIALYLDAATLSAATAAYSATSEVANSGTYVAGGATITFATPGATGTIAYAGPTSASTVSWTSFSATGFSAALVYNTAKTNKAISVHTFSSQSITAGTFTLTMPTNAGGTALINLA